MLGTGDILQILIISLSAMVPIALAAIGEIFGERAGVINIGLEGILLSSALISVFVAETASSPWVGLLAGVGVGVALGMLHGLVCVYLRGDHIISGVGINLLGAGLISYGLIAIWNVPGQHVVPEAARMAAIPTPYGGISYLTILTILLAIVAYYVINRTKLGVRISIVGEHPRAADVAGVNVEATRFWATTLGSALAGLGGAFMALDWFGVLVNELAAGRGFIALATVVFSKLNPLLALVGGLIFGFFDSLSVWVSSSSEIKRVVPSQLINTLPYVVTLLVVAGAIGRARFPSKLGQPYRRE